MQLKTVKTLADIPFKGVELIKVDNTISEVVIGGKLRVKAGQYGGIQCLVVTEGEKVQRHRVTATLEGFPDAIQHFETSWEAEQAERTFKDKGAEVTREAVSVVIDDFGSVVAETAPEATRELDEIPF